MTPKTKQFVVYVGDYDWGPCIEKFVYNAGKEIPASKIKASDFELNRRLCYKDSILSFSKGELKAIDAYCSDEYGNKINAESSTYITITMDVYPDVENSSPFVSYLLGTQFESVYGYEIENDRLNIESKKITGFVNEAASKFVCASTKYKIPEAEKRVSNTTEEGIELSYAFYIPKNKEKIPLILWFHGIGESGTDPYFTLFNAKGSALAGEKIQSHFKDGAAILMPQCPTGWLETIDSNSMGVRYWAPIDKDLPARKINKFINGLLLTGTDEEDEISEKKPFAAVSYYTEPVKQLLVDFLEAHPEIDTDRIYVGGCSAGGYMTMNMILQYPEFFAAAFPTCEYYLNGKITNNQIKALTKMPLWFTYAENDKTVNPKANSIPTIERLRNARHENLHTSVFEDVHDLYGKVFQNRNAQEGDPDYNKPYQYSSHSSWIYVLNDECFDDTNKKLNLFDWLSSQKKK